MYMYYEFLYCYFYGCKLMEWGEHLMYKHHIYGSIQNNGSTFYQ